MMAEGSLEEEVQYMVTEVWGWEVWGAGTTEILDTPPAAKAREGHRRVRERMSILKYLDILFYLVEL